MAVPIRSTATRLDLNGGRSTSSTYREFAPDRVVRSALVCTWEGKAGWSRPMRVLPDGCVDVVWSGSKVQVVRPNPVAAWHRLDGRTRTVGVRLRPGWAAAALGVPIRTLAEVSELDDIWSPRLVRTLEAMLVQATPGQAGRGVLADAIGRRLAVTDQADATVLGALRLLDRPHLPVEAVADTVGLSVRQFRRRFDGQVGVTPKTFQTIARFQRFRRHVTALSEGMTLARVAANCGYADQAHLAHDCRRLAHTTPSSLIQH